MFEPQETAPVPSVHLVWHQPATNQRWIDPDVRIDVDAASVVKPGTKTNETAAMSGRNWSVCRDCDTLTPKHTLWCGPCKTRNDVARYFEYELVEMQPDDLAYVDELEGGPYDPTAPANPAL